MKDWNHSPAHYLECGKIVSTHGVRGELRVQPWADSPDFLCEFRRFYLGRGKTLLEAESVRVSKNMVLLKAKGIDSIDDAVTLRGKTVYIDREDVPPDEDGAFFVQDILGLEAQDADTGKSWGRVTDVLKTGANDVYELTDADGTKRLIPMIPQVVLEINIADGFLLIRPLEGLFDA